MNTYATLFSSLHTAKTAGKQAPHKAVLLLSIMDLVEAGIITSPRIELSEDLEGTFARVWKRYIGSSIIFTPKVATPFWHLQNEPFYRLYMNNGQLFSVGIGLYYYPWNDAADGSVKLSAYGHPQNIQTAPPDEAAHGECFPDD